jgi:hypothetical protein
MSEDLTENLTEDITDEEQETIQKNKTYMHCKKDNPRYVPPLLKTTVEMENYYKTQAEVEKNQQLENILKANDEVCFFYVRRNCQLSPGEIMAERGRIY